MTAIPPAEWARTRIHVGFPLRLDARGRTAVVDEDAYLTGLIEQVLFTAPGERVNRPDFGAGLGRLVFAPGGEGLAASTQGMVQTALQQWLGHLLRVDAVHVEMADSRLEIVVEYTPLGSAQVRTARVTGEPPR